MDYKKLDEAAKALERASGAAFASVQYPHGQAQPCEHQDKVARAEVACALALIEEAKAT